MTKVSLGLPLAAAAAGTVATLFAPAKRLHIVCGTAWALFSLAHAWQYRKKLADDLGVASAGVCLKQKAMQKIGAGLRTAAYTPGRIRLYSRSLVESEQLAEQILTYFADYAEVDAVECNTLTGSVLITYEPEFFAENEELSQIEKYVKECVQTAQGRS